MAQKWDRHSIRAELNRRGHTLTGLAREHGLYESACRQALDGRSQVGAQVIAQALGVSVQDLWPDRYIRRQTERSSKTTSVASAISDDRIDKELAA